MHYAKQPVYPQSQNAKKRAGSGGNETARHRRDYNNSNRKKTEENNKILTFSKNHLNKTARLIIPILRILSE